MEKIYTEVQFRVNNTTLSVTVTKDLKKEEGNLKNFGYIQIHDGSIYTEEVFWDNLEWFFKINKDKKKEIKEELKEKGQYYKGVVKDVKRLVERAKELDLLWIKE
jgi:HKD family nuclease